jgi:hypothetical protein
MRWLEVWLFAVVPIAPVSSPPTRFQNINSPTG